MLVNTLEYTVLRDQGRRMVFVGNTVYNQMLYAYFSNLRACDLVSLEHAQQQDQHWFDQHQFLCAATTVSFKRLVVESLKPFDPHYVSIIGTGNAFNHVEVGSGTFVQHYNIATFENVTVGNHCTIACHTTLGHDTKIEDYCHIGSYSIINFAHVGAGCWLGLRTTMIGERQRVLNINDNSNFLFDSRVTRSTEQSGTYYGNRLVDERTSMEYAVTINT